MDKWDLLKNELEMAIISLMPYQDAKSKSMKKAYELVIESMKILDAKEKMEG